MGLRFLPGLEVGVVEGTFAHPSPEGLGYRYVVPMGPVVVLYRRVRMELRFLAGPEVCVAEGMGMF